MNAVAQLRLTNADLESMPEDGNRYERFYAAPEIFSEVLSPGASNQRRDRHVMRSLYTAWGAGEYWILDPEDRCFDVYRRGEAGRVLKEGDATTSVLPPGFSAPVAAFLA